jgi:protein tyrosine/serine phosphatase
MSIKERIRRVFLYIGCVIGSAILLFALFLLFENLTGNFHEALPGELYRSAQLDAGDVARYQQQYHIKSILNLRGENKGSPWYDTEVKESAEAGVTHLDFRMKAGRELTLEQAKELIEIMHNAPKPLLLHCRSGSDRTGLASALYFAAIAKKSEWESEKQLWIIYGHMPFYINSSYAMNRTFERLEPYLGFDGS